MSNEPLNMTRLRLDVESMRHSVVHALVDHQGEIQKQVEAEITDAYLILNGPHRGMKHRATNGPVLRLTNNRVETDNGVENLWEMPRVITHTLQTDGDTRKTYHFWLTEGTEGGAVTMVDLLIDLVGGEDE